MNSLLVTIAKFSETMLWVVGPLFLADLVALMIVVFRSGTIDQEEGSVVDCLLYTSPSPRDRTRSRMPSSA